MKMGFMTIVLNGGDYLDFSLANTLNLAKRCDDFHIVIVEGSDQFAIFSKENGLSVDGTEDIILDFISELEDGGCGDKVSYIRARRVQDKRVLRNIAMEVFEKQDIDYYFVKDHDELIKASDMETIIDIIEEKPMDVYDLEHYMFGNQFCWRIDGSAINRIFRFEAGMRYIRWHIVPDYPDRKSLYINIPLYHYGYLISKWRWMDKTYQRARQNKYYYTEISPSSNNIMNTPTILQITGQVFRPYPLIYVPVIHHPKEILGHPLFNASADEIYNGEMFPTYRRNDNE